MSSDTVVTGSSTINDVVVENSLNNDESIINNDLNNDLDDIYLSLIKMGVTLFFIFSTLCFIAWKVYHKSLNDLNNLKVRQNNSNNKKNK